MNNFKIIPVTFSTMQILKELHENPELWNEHPFRTSGHSVHREADDILLHFDFDASGQFKFYPAIGKIPSVHKLIEALLKALYPDENRRKTVLLGRVVLTRLPMQGIIYQHIDMPAHTEAWDRFHMCITGADSIFYCGDEELQEAPGLCFWFNNALKHSVVNDGNVRIHLIVDIKK